jgi:hypothetical protein
MAANVGLLLIAIVLIAGVLWDTFETIILPRRVTRRFRLPRLFYCATSLPLSVVALPVPEANPRALFLRICGPLSVAVALWRLGTEPDSWLRDLSLGGGFANQHGNKLLTFGRTCYLSGTTFFLPLVLGDVTPRGDIAQFSYVMRQWRFQLLAIVILLASANTGLFATGGEHLPDGCACRLPANGRRTVAATYPATERASTW